MELGPEAKRARCDDGSGSLPPEELLLGDAALTGYSTIRLPGTELFQAEGGGGFTRLLTPNRKLELRWVATAKPVVTRGRGRGKTAKRSPEEDVQARLAGSCIYFSAYGKEVGKFPADAARCLVPMLLQDYIEIEARVGDKPPRDLEVGTSVPLQVRVKTRPALWSTAQTVIAYANLALQEKAEWSRVVRSYSLPFLLKLLGLKHKHRAVALANASDGESISIDDDVVDVECANDVDDGDDPERNIEMSDEVAAQLGTSDALERRSLPKIRMPAGVLQVSLREYQAQAVLWMWLRENPKVKLPDNFIDSVGAEDTSWHEPQSSQLDPMWEEYELQEPTKLPLYFNKVTGEMTYRFPESGLAPCRGGILADDMGLGKTVMCIALLSLDRVPELRKLTNDDKLEQSSVRGGTLMVLPVALLHQWASEISKHCKGTYKPTVHICHGAGANASNLHKFDIVLTTYGLLATGNAAAISKIHWHRIILDEGHIIKNRQSKRAIAVMQLRAARRWVVTGTPMQNNIDELYSPIRFLNLHPWCVWAAWKHAISDPFRHGDVGGALNEAHRVVQPLLLRRTKQTRDHRTGEPLVKLPSKFVHVLNIELSPMERCLYNALYRTMRAKFDNLMKSDKVLKFYFIVLQMLTMLRRATCHPFLSFTRSDAQDTSLQAFAQRCFGGKLSFAGEDCDTSKLDSELVNNLLNDALDQDRVVCGACGETIVEQAHQNPCGHVFCASCSGVNTSLGECPACQKAVAGTISGTSKDLPEQLQGSKIRVLVKALRADLEAGRSVVVFSQWPTFLQLVGRALDTDAPSIPWRQYDGTSSIAQRRALLEWFQHGDRPDLFQQTSRSGGRVLLISLMAGGVGLNLVTASRLYLLDLWWNPALEEQAIQRIHRIGQTQDVHIYKFVVKDTIDEGIVALQAAKSHLCEGLFQKGALCGQYTKLGLDDFKLLFSNGDAKPDPKGVAGG